MKLSSRDCLEVLRKFNIADSDNIPRQIKQIQTSNPNAINLMVAFKFNRRSFLLLMDETADDKLDYILEQIKTKNPDTKGKLLVSPIDNTTYAVPFHGKSSYLFEATVERNRLDNEIRSRYPEISRSTLQKYIKSGYVTVNGAVSKSVKLDVSLNDEIALTLPVTNNYDNESLPIVYIDDDIIVVDKPAGILTHSKGEINEEFSVADFFKRYTTYNLDSNRPGIVHRLDRDTSGILVGARNTETAELLKKQFADRKIKKTYIAIVNGRPKLDSANIDLPIGRNPKAPSTFRVDANGKPALTHYDVLTSNNTESVVKLQPHTGRTHQLRVHMQYINTPIVGDRVYGKADSRLYLHALSIELTDTNGERKTFSTNIPDEFYNKFPDIKA